MDTQRELYSTSALAMCRVGTLHFGKELNSDWSSDNHTSTNLEKIVNDNLNFFFWETDKIFITLKVACSVLS